ncbi:MAG: GxxExxY protein [Anaerolineaceae bacterium]|nr:GxxExxY protein [Anaerolineaceae bacterium]
MEATLQIEPLNHIKLPELTELVIAAAQNVLAEIGPGFETQIYQRALGLEMEAQDLPFHREVWIDLFYRNQRVGHKRVDFVIGDLMVLVKSETELKELDEIQAYTFLKNSGCEAGLMLNFGKTNLEIKHLEK